MNCQNHKKNIQAIVLAAGQSQRFGTDKTHICINDIPIAIQIARTLQSIAPHTLIVIDESNQILRECAKQNNITTIINHNNSGIGSSICAAVKATPNADGWLICLADMPYIQKTSYEKIFTALQISKPDKIVRPKFNGKMGHPVGFNRHFYELLANKQGDDGAKDILNKHPSLIDYIDIDDAYILQDIDTPQDMQTLSKENPSHPLHIIEEIK